MANLVNKEHLGDISYLQMYINDIFADENLYIEAQKQCIKKALDFHLKNNSDYKKYFETFNNTVGLMTAKDFNIADIPLLPSSLFKREGVNLSSVKEEEIVKHCTSSGTKGSLSIVPRDNLTLANFFTSIITTMHYMLEATKPGKCKVIILGPSPKESGNLWFAYAITSMVLEYQLEYCQKGKEYSIDYVISKLEAEAKEGNQVVIVGPPPRVVDLCKQIQDTKKTLALPKDSIIVCAGGWKRRNNEAISKKEYIQVVSDTFEIDESNVRDCYNMVELNTVLCECKCHQKHVYPWVDVFARDPGTNEVLEDGQVGILSFYDGGAFSFPGFILSEDYGIVHSEKCACGRVGKRVEIVRRMERVEARGCALKMDNSKGTEVNIEGKNRFYKSFFRNPDKYNP